MARLIDPAEETVVVALHRSGRLAAFERPDQERVAGFVPPLRWAVEMRRRLAPAMACGALAEASLDALSVVVVTDSAGRVWLANCAAERLLSGGDGLTVRDGRLVVGDPAAATELQRVMLGTVAMPLSDRAVER